METRKSAAAAQLDLKPADRIALFGLAGVLMGVFTWGVLAAVDLVFREAPSLRTALLAPTGYQSLVRLVAVASVLTTTLVLQRRAGRRFEVETERGVERNRLYQIHAHSPESILCLDRDLKIVYANPAAERLVSTRLLTGTLVGRGCCEVFWPEGQATGCLGEEVLRTAEMCRRTVHDLRDGEVFWFEEIVYPVFDDVGEIEQLVEVIRDVTEQVTAERTIHRMAFHDPVTNLPNRVLFQDRLRNAILHARRRDEIVAVCYVDLDQFKSINDSFGSSTGDVVLAAATTAFLGVLRDEDTVARVSGDEFAIVARIESRADAKLLAERVLGALRRDMVVEGHDLTLSACMGVATFPHDGDNEIDLLKNADAAMNRAAELGHNSFKLYEPEMSRSAEESLKLEMHLRHALENGEFELYYQPQIDSRSGSPIGVEALIRWNHPHEGLLAPVSFIEFAERAGFMGEIGQWVVRTACAQAQAWLDEGIDIGRMAVNLSAHEFEQFDVVEVVERALREVGLEPQRLEIEITETTAMRSADAIIETLERLQALGVRVAIDDFGTGYSSMSYLKRFPVQTLKIAQTFMRDVHLDAQSGAITTMLIDLCRELELDIVCEGVEHPSELEFLRRQGCFIIQGYIYSQPLPAGEAGKLLGSVTKPLAYEQ